MAESTHKTSLVVLGAGPGGYTAAFHAAQLGLEVTLIDLRENPGGVCLNVGCIPSKALLHAAEVIQQADHSKDFGITFEAPTIDVEKLRTWKDQIVERLTGGLGQLAGRHKITYIQGRATFDTPHSFVVEGNAIERVEFEHAIIATGSRPSSIPGLSLESKAVMDSTGALELQNIPESLLVVGGGYIGLELGSVYSVLGSTVTVVELLDGILPGADRDLVRPLERWIKKSFADVLLKTKVTSMTETSQGIEVQFEGETNRKQTFERVLVSVGRRPNSEGLGLENTAVRVTPKGFLEVDRQCRTNESHIFAIGDIAGEPMLAHKAMREGKVAAEVIAGQKSEFDNVAIPAVVFTHPEIAWVGLTETEAKAKGIEVKVARFPWAASGRAMTLDQTDGLTKMLFEPETGRILGVGITGANAGEMIAEGALAIEMAAVAEDLALTIHTHPTLSETVGETAELFLGHATHIFRK